MTEQRNCITCQPIWVWAIMHAGKDLENRSSRIVPGRGTYYLHASQEQSAEIYRLACPIIRAAGFTPPAIIDLPKGLVLARMELDGWIAESDSRWFTGPLAVRITSVEALERPFHASGKLGGWTARPKIISYDRVQLILPGKPATWTGIALAPMGDNWWQCRTDDGETVTAPESALAPASAPVQHEAPTLPTI